MRNKFKKPALIVLISVFLLANGHFFRALAADDAGDIQDKIDSTQKKINQTQKTLDASQTQLQQNKKQVSSTQSILQQTETEISRKENEIKNISDRIELNRQILASYIREMYFNNQDDVIVQLALNADMSFNDLADNADNLISAKEKVLGILEEIQADKNQLVQSQNELAEKKDQHQKILKGQLGQQVEIKQDIVQAQATLSELNAKINKLRGELSDLLGENVSFDDVVKAAGFAAEATGVRKDFILGMLVVESGLGRYTGGCTAEKSRMSSYRLGIFKNICKELDYDWKKKKVSCPPSSYKGTGGAMGVAQFMSDTWLGYKSSIAAKTGNNPPDPWSLTDGVVGMALKLARGGATSKSGECKAAKLYLSGSTSSKYQWYCDRVAYWSKNYEDKMD